MKRGETRGGSRSPGGFRRLRTAEPGGGGERGEFIFFPNTQSPIANTLIIF
ncbi:MAG TPA: hypothetical protein VK203_08580 [Nostocaceae cyanobacterium]|nr:hypothetical protein [Nostocaceae cyanobacterium]